MQSTIYYRDEDGYIIEKIEEKANKERKSKSAVVLSILEEHFESRRRIGEILQDIGVLEERQLNSALDVQKTEENEKKLGQITVEEDYVSEVDLDRALTIQERVN